MQHKVRNPDAGKVHWSVVLIVRGCLVSFDSFTIRFVHNSVECSSQITGSARLLSGCQSGGIAALLWSEKPAVGECYSLLVRLRGVPRLSMTSSGSVSISA